MGDRKTKVFLFVCMLMIRSVYAQDPEFSQFYANPLYLNPALAGMTICPKINVNYRNQWPGLDQAFITYNASFDMYVNALHGGIGLIVTSDQAGAGSINTTMIAGMYAYKFNITSRLQASGALKVGYYMRNLAWDKLTFGDTTQQEPTENLRTSIGVADFSAGIFLSYDDLIYGGIAVDHLSQPNTGFYTNKTSPLYMKYTIHVGSVINLKGGKIADEEREFSISPNILYQQQYNFHQLNIGLYLTIDPFIGGLWFRHNFENADAVIPMLGFHWKNLRVAYSYDFTVSKLKGASGGAHEVSASWQFPCIEKRRHIRAIKCPRF